MANQRHAVVFASIYCAAALILSGCGDDDYNVTKSGNESGPLSVTVLGTRPATVSGGDALIAVARSKQNVGPGAALYDAGDLSTQNITVTLNGDDVTSRFQPGQPARTGSALVGLVDGLQEGANELTVRSQGGAESSLTLTDYPISGPIFSGPRQDPFVCQTQAAGLGNTLDPESCSAETKTEYMYLPNDSDTFQPFDPDGPRPTDIATTTTTNGQNVPFIVRRETGTINRSIYKIAILDDPDQPGPDPWTQTDGWNGRLVYRFGGGCGTGYTQGAFTVPVLIPQLLSQGFAVVTSTLNTAVIDCNTTLSAETALMIKEHFAETYGDPVYTIGNGSSGGALQQYALADNYPGIVDGINPGDSFPDNAIVSSTIANCGLLVNYFDESSQTFTETQKAAVADVANFATCRSWNNFIPVLVRASTGCDGSVPADLIYDPVNNPDGARCTLQDAQVNLVGTDPATGFARSLRDNVGIQYGLNALNDGTISEAQFIDLNQNVGGFDIDGNITSKRETADLRALQATYGAGLLTSAEGGLATTPIIDWHPYNDRESDGSDIHTLFYSFATRQRLLDAGGSAENQVILIEPQPKNSNVPIPVTELSTIASMDQWLANIRADRSKKSLAKKIADDKPADLTDACYDQNGTKIAEPASYNSTGQCHQLYPPFGDSSVGAGGPVSIDVLKCQLKPITTTDYAPAVNFTDAQLATLRSIFPQGVCDYSKPSVGEVSYQGPWISYGTTNSSAQNRRNAFAEGS